MGANRHRRRGRGPRAGDAALARVVSGLEDLLAASCALTREPRSAFRGGQTEPLVLGFCMRAGPEGTLEAQRFGNVRSVGAQAVVEAARCPLIDIVDRADVLSVVVEVPGVGEHDVDVDVRDNTVTIQTLPSARRQYFAQISLPARAVAGSQRLSLENGLLRIDFEREEQARQAP